MSVISKTSIFSESLNFILNLNQDPKSSETFNVVKMPEKGGVGVLAAHTLERGDLVVNSRAVLLVSVEISFFDIPEWIQIRKMAVDLLPIETRKRIARMFGNGESEEESISNAIDMNSFDINLGLNSDVPFFAMFIKPAQLNHDCRPNTGFYIDSQTLQVHMHALRTINSGEEMTISYRDMTQTRADRQREISEYGFKCTCDHCRMSDIQAEESDQRIIRINELVEKLNDWTQVNFESKAMIDEADELVKLYMMENLHNNIPDGYTLSAFTYNSFGHVTRAQWLASKAVESGLIVYGPKWEELDTLTELIENPQEHWSYNARILNQS